MKKAPSASGTSVSGFTLIELMLVVSLILLVSVVVQVKMAAVVKKVRDARRLADFRMISVALNNYRSENNTFPVERNGGMYVVSYEPGFLGTLVPKYLSSRPRDPINDPPPTFDWFIKNSRYYAYYYYQDLTTEGNHYGCGNRHFALLGIRKLEGGTSSKSLKAYCGPNPPITCPPWGIANVCRDWSLEFDYSALFFDN